MNPQRRILIVVTISDREWVYVPSYIPWTDAASSLHLSCECFMYRLSCRLWMFFYVEKLDQHFMLWLVGHNRPQSSNCWMCNLPPNFSTLTRQRWGATTLPACKVGKWISLLLSVCCFGKIYLSALHKVCYEYQVGIRWRNMTSVYLKSKLK